MKCPIPIFVLLYPDGQADSKRQDCLQEECAWYDNSTQRCSIRNISDKLSLLYFVELEKNPGVKKVDW
jgi:hypothetical protein